MSLTAARSGPPRLLLVSLLLFALLLLSGCGAILRGAGEAADDFATQAFRQGRHGPLSEQERDWAVAAWRYFEAQYRPETGLVDSAPNYPFASPATMADALAATVAARRLGLIEVERFDERVHHLLAFLQRMPLSADGRPARGYHSQEGRLAGYGLEPADLGTAPLELSRLLIWLDILERGYPRFAPFVERTVGRWNLCGAVDEEGTLFATVAGQPLYEGSAAEQSYAALGFRVWGCAVDPSVHARRFTDLEIEGLAVPAAGARNDGARSVATATAHLLHGLEFNWDRATDRSSLDSIHTDRRAARAAREVRRAQERRWERSGLATARATYVRSEPPFVVDNSLGIDGAAWAVQTAEGAPRDDLALIATGAGFAQWALDRGPHGDALLATLRSLHDPDRGWFEGRYEESGLPEPALSAATNALVLEALLHKVQGRLHPGGRRPPGPR